MGSNWAAIARGLLRPIAADYGVDPRYPNYQRYPLDERLPDGRSVDEAFSRMPTIDATPAPMERFPSGAGVSPLPVNPTLSPGTMERLITNSRIAAGAPAEPNAIARIGLGSPDTIPVTPIGAAPRPPAFAYDRERGITPYERQMIDQPITIPTEPKLQRVQRGGFLGTLKGMGKGLLEGLAYGGQQGVGQAIGGGLTGAILGGVNPQLAENIKYNLRLKPQFEYERAKAEHEIGQREGIIERIAKRTGYDPISGEETPEQEYRRTGRELQGEQIAATREYRQQNAERFKMELEEKIRHNKATEGEKQLNDFWLRNPGKATPKELAESAGRPYLSGWVPPAKAGADNYENIPGYPGWMRNKQTGQAERIPGLEGVAPGSATLDYRESRDALKDIDTDEKDAKKQMADFEKAKSDAGVAAADLNAVRKALDEKKTGKGEGKYKGREVNEADLTDAEGKYDAARSAEQAASAAVKSHKYVKTHEIGGGIYLDTERIEADRKDVRRRSASTGGGAAGAAPGGNQASEALKALNKFLNDKSRSPEAKAHAVAEYNKRFGGSE